MLKNRILSLSSDDTFCLRFTKAERQTLLDLAQSRKEAERKQCAEWFRIGAGVPRNLPILLELAHFLIPAKDTRWGVLIDLTRFAESHSKELWPLITRWGSVSSKDIRMGIACCLLEHVLQYHFEEYFERARRMIEDGNRRFAYTLKYCKKLGRAEELENAHRFDEFVDSLRLRQWR